VDLLVISNSLNKGITLSFIRKIPTTSVPIFIPEVVRAARGFYDKKTISRFEGKLKSWLGVEDVVLVNKGTAALYLILQALKKLHPERDEVVYPAYTVPTLKLAFDKLGLKTRCCDISRYTFNMDAEKLPETVNERTLAVIPVHMFGFPMRLEKVFEIAGKDITVIEDPCQAPGARLDGKFVGSYAPAAIFSFCKGKNISTFQGGFAALNDRELAKMVRIGREEFPETASGIKSFVLMMIFTLAMRPGVYGPLYPLIKRFKSEEVHQHFHGAKYTGFQAALGEILLEKLEMINAQRRSFGMYLYEKLAKLEHIIVPEIVRGAEPVFNHMPVVFLSAKDRDKARRKLWDWGIDTARMYLQANHQIYDLGYPENAFPEARLVAEGLVTLPSHPYMTQRDLERIIGIVSKPGG